MQTAPTHPQGAYDAGDHVPRLHPVVAVSDQPTATHTDAPGRGDGDAPQSPYDAPGGSDVMIVGPDKRSLEVHYALDQIANVWVANVLDRETGEVVRTVPSTRVLHQLAELGSDRGRVDARA